MDETAVFKLFDYIDSNYTDHTALHTRSEQYVEAVEWATQTQRWDIVIRFGHALYSHYVHSVYPGSSFLGKRDLDPPSEEAKALWEQGRWLAGQGLLAARELVNLAEEIWFLSMLLRLSTELGDHDVALEYARHQLFLVGQVRSTREEEATLKSRIAHRIHILGNRAGKAEDFFVARTCYLMCLSVYQELGYRNAMAEELDFLAANEDTRIEKCLQSGEEISDELREVVGLLWKFSNTIRHEVEAGEAEPAMDTSILGMEAQAEMAQDSMYERLQVILDRLTSLT